MTKTFAILAVCLAAAATVLSGGGGSPTANANATPKLKAERTDDKTFLKTFAGDWLVVLEENSDFRKYLTAKNTSEKIIEMVVSQPFTRRFTVYENGEFDAMTNLSACMTQVYDRMRLDVPKTFPRIHSFSNEDENVKFYRDGHTLYEEHKLSNGTISIVYGYQMIGSALFQLYHVNAATRAKSAFRKFQPLAHDATAAEVWPNEPVCVNGNNTAARTANEHFAPVLLGVAAMFFFYF